MTANLYEAMGWDRTPDEDKRKRFEETYCTERVQVTPPPVTQTPLNPQPWRQGAVHAFREFLRSRRDIKPGDTVRFEYKIPGKTPADPKRDVILHDPTGANIDVVWKYHTYGRYYEWSETMWRWSELFDHAQNIGYTLHAVMLIPSKGEEIS